MTKMPNALLNGKSVKAEEAVRLRNDADKRKAVRPSFQCDECGQGVKPHASGGNFAAHFEHFERNPECSQSDKRFR